MKDDALKQKLREMIVERLFLDIEPGEIDDNASLVDAYGVDSVSLLELVVGIEEVFGIRMSDEDFDVTHFESVASLADYVRNRLPEA